MTGLERMVPLVGLLVAGSYAYAVPILVPKPREMSMTGGTADSPLVEERRDPSVPREGYELEIAEGRIRIKSSDAAGSFYAHETLKQLAEGKDGTRYPCLRIRDWPEYEWRGVLIDEGRHFFGIDTVKKLIRAMAYHKLNTLHWHLTEDQGWRLALDRWPELVRWGASRASSPLPGELRTGDGKPYGPYYYSKAQIREIQAYARERHVKIVPEIEIPGHSRAALAAYPRFSCLGDRLPRRPDSTWGVKCELFCAGNDEAIAFLESVLDEVCELFSDSDTIHIGGDECPKQRWESCPKCQARMRQLGLRSEDELQGWMTRHFTEYLAARGKRVVGWDDILAGGVPKGTVVMSWRGTVGALVAASNGVASVVCPRTHVYLDYRQGIMDDPWGGLGGQTLSHVYSFDPMKGLASGQRKYVLGSQGLLWSENIFYEDELFWLGFPRLAAIAEVLWTADPRRDYGEFSRRMAFHIPRIRAMGISCAPTPEGLPANVATEPVPNNGNFGYDWHRRHARICREQSSWRSQPDVLLVGDGLIQQWAGTNTIAEADDPLVLPRWRESFAGYRVLNMGFGGDCTQHVLWRLEDGEIKNNDPKLVVLMIGINNLLPRGENGATSGTPEETVQGVRRILEIIHKKAKSAEIVLMGVLPCLEANHPCRDAVTRVNRMLSRLPRHVGEGHVQFLDVGERFIGANGEIPRALMPDGIHLSDDGYRILTAALRPYLEKCAGNCGEDR